MNKPKEEQGLHTPHYKEFESLTSDARRNLKAEPKSFSIKAPTSADIAEGVLDTSAAQLLVSEALRELAESIPNGQRERTQIFMARAQLGLDGLKEALIRSGVNIE